MSEDKKRTRRTDKARRRFGRFRSALVFVGAATIVGGLAWKAGLWDYRSADAQLAAIYAARAIPESEDAGVAYIKLAESHMPLPPNPPVVDKQALSLTYKKPWLGKDYPKLAAWIDERRDLMSELIEISKMEKCRLPIPSKTVLNLSYSDPIRQMTGWSLLLIRSAYNDVAEGRIDAAIDKCICVLRMGGHMYQQPHLRGTSNESIALHVLNEFITENELTQGQLEAIEAALLPPKNRWKQDSRVKVKVQRLLERSRRPRITQWRSYWIYRKMMRKRGEHSHENVLNSYLWMLSERRSAYILIALRRFKNETGHWPQSLDLIEPSLSTETLTDSRNNTPFIYELAGEDFKLRRK